MVDGKQISSYPSRQEAGPGVGQVTSRRTGSVAKQKAEMEYGKGPGQDRVFKDITSVTYLFQSGTAFHNSISHSLFLFRTHQWINPLISSEPS